MSTPPRPGLATRAKNVNQRPGKILMSYRRTRRSSTQLAADKKAAKEAAAVVAAKNATIATRIAQLKDVRLNLRHASTAGKHTTAIEKSRSDSELKPPTRSQGVDYLAIGRVCEPCAHHHGTRDDAQERLA